MEFLTGLEREEQEAGDHWEKGTPGVYGGWRQGRVEMGGRRGSFAGFVFALVL